MSESSAAELAESPFELVVENWREEVGEVPDVDAAVMTTQEKMGEMPVVTELCVTGRGGEE